MFDLAIDKEVKIDEAMENFGKRAGCTIRKSGQSFSTHQTTKYIDSRDITANSPKTRRVSSLTIVILVNTCASCSRGFFQSFVW